MLRRLAFLTLLMVTIAIGCERRSTPPDAHTTEPSVAKTTMAQANDSNAELTEPGVTAAPQVEQDPIEQDSSYSAFVTELYESAKKSGSTTASNASTWMAEKFSGATDAGFQASDESLTWLQTMYETARSNGETTATSATDWLSNDISNAKRWEYKVVNNSSTDEASLENQLNVLGSERWECFHIEGARFFYKRRPTSYVRSLPMRDVLRLLPLLPTSGSDGE